MSPKNSQDDFDAKLGRIGDGKKGRSERYVTQVMRPLGRAGDASASTIGSHFTERNFQSRLGRRRARGCRPDRARGRRVVAWARYIDDRR